MLLHAVQVWTGLLSCVFHGTLFTMRTCYPIMNLSITCDYSDNRSYHIMMGDSIIGSHIMLTHIIMCDQIMWHLFICDQIIFVHIIMCYNLLHWNRQKINVNQCGTQSYLSIFIHNDVWQNYKILVSSKKLKIGKLVIKNNPLSLKVIFSLSISFNNFIMRTSLILFNSNQILVTFIIPSNFNTLIFFTILLLCGS